MKDELLEQAAALFDSMKARHGGSYLNDQEIQALSDSGLASYPHFRIQDARSLNEESIELKEAFSAGIEYYYFPMTDEFIRSDVVEWIHNYRSDKARLN